MTLKPILAVALSLCSLTAAAQTQDRPVDKVIAGVKEIFAPDKRVAVWTVKADDRGVLKGETDNPEAHRALLSKLAAENITFTDSITLLPNVPAEKQWAITTLSVGHMRPEPDGTTELISQAIMGTPVRILKQDADEGMYYIQTPDGYLGWMYGYTLSFRTAEGMNQWREADRRVVTALEATLYAEPKVDDTAVVTDMLLGNILEYKGKKGKFVRLALPDGREGYALKSVVEDVKTWASQGYKWDVIRRNAYRMMGRPYLWGGMSAKMSDCSGFARTTYFSSGIILMRDASQQALTGEIFDSKEWREKAQPGDLLFSGNRRGRVTHVMIYVGDGKFIHSSQRIKVNSIDPVADDFLNLRYMTMSRVNGQLGTKGITTVARHPWYFNQK